MILRTCDRCGKEMEPIYFPPYTTFCLDPKMDVPFSPKVFVSVEESAGKTRPVDLCDECSRDVYNDIFNYINFNAPEVKKNG